MTRCSGSSIRAEIKPYKLKLSEDPGQTLRIFFADIIDDFAKKMRFLGKALAFFADLLYNIRCSIIFIYMTAILRHNIILIKKGVKKWTSW